MNRKRVIAGGVDVEILEFDDGYKPVIRGHLIDSVTTHVTFDLTVALNLISRRWSVIENTEAKERANKERKKAIKIFQIKFIPAVTSDSKYYTGEYYATVNGKYVSDDPYPISILCNDVHLLRNNFPHRGKGNGKYHRKLR